MFGGILDFQHILVECLLHLGKTVLQFSEGVGLVGVGDGLVVVAFGDLFGHVQQVHHGAGGLSHYLLRHPQDQHQADEDHQADNVGQQVVVCQDLAVRKYQDQTPVGARYGLESYVAELSVDGGMPRSLFTVGYLVA